MGKLRIKLPWSDKEMVVMLVERSELEIHPLHKLLLEEG